MKFYEHLNFFALDYIYALQIPRQQTSNRPLILMFYGLRQQDVTTEMHVKAIAILWEKLEHKSDSCKVLMTQRDI